MITGVLFDKDGTLFDFQRSWSAWAVMALRDLTGGDEAQAADLAEHIDFDWHTRQFRPESCVIAGTDADIVEALLPALPGWSRAGLLSRLQHSAARAPMQEVVDLKAFLKALRGRGLKLGVATNDSERSARAHLEEAGIAQQFDFIAGADSGFGAKPAPGMCLGFAKAMGLAPAQVLMVGDSLHDLHAGQAAGMQRLGVLTGVATRPDLAPHADLILPDIGALPDHLDAQNCLIMPQ